MAVRLLWNGMQVDAFQIRQSRSCKSWNDPYFWKLSVDGCPDIGSHLEKRYWKVPDIWFTNKISPHLPQPLSDLKPQPTMVTMMLLTMRMRRRQSMMMMMVWWRGADVGWEPWQPQGQRSLPQPLMHCKALLSLYCLNCNALCTSSTICTAMQYWTAQGKFPALLSSCQWFSLHWNKTNSNVKISFVLQGVLIREGDGKHIC